MRLMLVTALDINTDGILLSWTVASCVIVSVGVIIKSTYIKPDVIPKFIRSMSHSVVCNKLIKSPKFKSVHHNEVMVEFFKCIFSALSTTVKSYLVPSYSREDKKNSLITALEQTVYVSLKLAVMHNNIYEKCHTHTCTCNEIGPRPCYLAEHRARALSSVVHLYSFLSEGWAEAWGVAVQVGLFQWQEEKFQGTVSKALREIWNREHKEDRSTPEQDYVEKDKQIFR